MALNSGSDMEHDEFLTRIYRAAADERPLSRIDAAIRAAARREAGAGPRPLSRLRTWQVPVSLAAVVVLSATLVLMMREEGADRLETVVEPEQPRVTVPVQPAESRVPPVEAPASPPRTAQSPVQPPAANMAPSAPQSSAPARQSFLAEKTAEKTAEKAAGKASGEATGKATEKAAEKAEPPPESRREVATMADGARPMMRSAPAPAAADAMAGRMARSAPAASAVASAAPPLWQDLIDQPADKWIQRILEWQRAGRSADAEALVREFLHRFPQQPLPAEIRQP